MWYNIFLSTAILFANPYILISSSINTTTITKNQQIQEDMHFLKFVTEMSDHLKKWNDLFLTSLEPRMIATATTLANIDSNIKNLQERAHVWDTFQLHVTAWNDQLASLDRKADILSKGQEKLLALEPRINAIIHVEQKIDDTSEKMSAIESRVSELKQGYQNLHVHKDHNNLFNEFAMRGILSSVKAIEKKLDQILLSQQNTIIHKRTKEKPRLSIKCNTPRIVEELLNDISSKVDIIFDKINGKEENNESDYGSEDYFDDGSGNNLEVGYTKVVKKRSVHNDNILDLLNQVSKIDNVSQTVLDTPNSKFEKLQQFFEKCEFPFEIKLEKILDNHFERQKKYFESLLLTCKHNKTCVAPAIDNEVENDDSVMKEPNESACEDLDRSHKSGVYFYRNHTEFNSNNRTFYKKYCEVHGNISWTVIQRRENHTQHFNLSWLDYKHGFGDLNGNFWFGNDFISKLSEKKDLILRVELEDFDGRRVWAEYKTFIILPEEHNYQLIIGGYRGNASDSFTSHNGSLFSTFDRKNDKAPECCPCAVSYGAGWWFNSCFESNLNGIYHEKGKSTGYYAGIIWENWLGNYSLKKTLMMVRSLGKQKFETTTSWPYYEDP